MQKVAILGGTFNPIHNGHIKLAENALMQFQLDSCWFMPAPNPPHKLGMEIADYADRMAMIRLAIAPYRQFEVSDFESRRQGASYTADTLRQLTALYPDIHFLFLVGADSFYEIESWRCPETILELAELIVADRDYASHHSTLEEHAQMLRNRYRARIHFIHAEEVDISSAEIRRILQTGRRGAERMIPESVYAYIKECHLYGQ